MIRGESLVNQIEYLAKARKGKITFDAGKSCEADFGSLGRLLVVAGVADHQRFTGIDLQQLARSE